MHDEFNAPATAKRLTLPPLNKFSIGELSAMPPYFGWVDCATGHGDFKMLLGGNDDGVAMRFFWNGCYEKTTLQAWAWFAKSAEVALDVGAHTGAYTLAALAANPKLIAVAFEPYFMNFARLNLNLRVNRANTANSFMYAVGARNEMLPFSTSTGLDYLTTGGSIGTRKNAFTTNVQVVALDAFINPTAKTKVKLVKIDTEGFEAQCIEGMKEIIAAARPVIFFECIEPTSGAAVEALLAKHGYRFFEVDDNAGTISPVVKIQPHLDAAGNPIYGKFNRIALPDGDINIDMIAG